MCCVITQERADTWATMIHEFRQMEFLYCKILKIY
jgi:hypothetical protein